MLDSETGLLGAGPEDACSISRDHRRGQRWSYKYYKRGESGRPVVGRELFMQIPVSDPGFDTEWLP